MFPNLVIATNKQANQKSHPHQDSWEAEVALS